MRGALAIAAALGALWLALLRPGTPLPPELPVIAGLLVAAPRRLAGPLRGLVVALLLAGGALALADAGTGLAYRRPFNPVLDGELLPAGYGLLAGSVGAAGAALAAVALLLALLLALRVLWWATGRVRRVGAALPVPARAAIAALAVAAGVALVATGSGGAAQEAVAHVRDAARARADLAAFRAAAARDPWATAAPGAILPALRGVDVVVVFVESYGHTALADPLYRPATTAALAEVEADARAAGLDMRSGWLEAPMVGGQSWLAHASLLSGLTVGDQGRYRALIASPRQTLVHLAARAGWTTAAVMPAITEPWPEGDWFGYGRILAARDLGYRGEPFNWVTMPDQFTLSVLGRDLLPPGPRPPAFVVTALISSHAPWTPVPTLLPWDAVGDGSVWDAAAVAGEAPASLWRDPDRVRRQYGRAIDYSLRAVGAFAGLPRARPVLFVVLGDHQPAEFVSREPGNRAVPVHLIGPEALLARVDGWGWPHGPEPGGTPRPMAAFRDGFLEAFGFTNGAAGLVSQ